MSPMAVKLWKRALGTAVILLLAAVSAATAAPQVRLTGGQEERFLKRMSVLPEEALRAVRGMTPSAVSGILAFREKSGKFTTVDQFRRASGLTDEEYDKVVAPYARRLDEGSRAPTAGAGKREKMARLGMGERVADKPAGVTAEKPPNDLGLTVRRHYYSVLPGYDLSVMTDDQRRAFLEAINTELCTCGCQDETLGFCLVNDPGCPVVKARVRQVYIDIVGAPPVPPKKSGGR